MADRSGTVRMAALVFLWSLHAVVRAQCPDGATLTGPELVVNGDFEAGDTGFSSGYISCPGPCDTEATYTVLANPSIANGAFVGDDHSSGSGNFMAVNGDPSAGTSVWCQTVVVEPYTTYLFSAWVATLFLDNPAQLLFTINGQDLGTAIDAPDSQNLWVPFNASWSSSNSTVATICIVNNNTLVQGNDFGLDDISFQACCASIPDASMSLCSCGTAPVELSALEGYDYLWSTGDTTRTIIVPPGDSSTWSVLVSSACAQRLSIFTVDAVDTAFADVFIPNVFTPNGDGLNEVFGPVSLVPVSGSFSMFNRWGELLFRGSLNEVWHGDRRGEPCPDGTYVYLVKGRNECGGRVDRVGSVTLLR
jgi:gliding motility-associated-like protein